MLYREIPKNGDKLSAIGYGAMRFPGKMGKIDEEKAAKQIYMAIDKGMNYIDTAYFYHGGKSEPFLGKILSKNGYRDKVKLATKLPPWQAKNKKEMDAILDDQLSKLQTDRIEYYLIHSLNGELWDNAKKNGVIEFINDALKSGKIHNIGFSFHGAIKDFKRIVDDFEWTFCQIQYNYLDVDYQAGREGLEYAASKNLGIIIMEPLRGGNLAKTPPPEVQSIWDQADKKRTPADWSLSWIWNHPEVTCIISGMNDESQIIENVEIASRALPNTLSEKELNLVDKAAEIFRSLMKSLCTGCQYCIPCPFDVNIPNCLNTHNSFYVFKDKGAKFVYALFSGGILGKKGLASQCTSCNVCLEKCPQNLPIPDLLKDVSKDMDTFSTKMQILVLKIFKKLKIF